jgi:protein-S-isoprenylcysteine O-methyltransferase Ste14
MIKEHNTTKQNDKIHNILARSYTVFLLCFLAGVSISQYFKIHMFKQPLNILGMALIFLGSILMFWAQNTSRNTKDTRHAMNTNTDSHLFKKGPYRFLRYPTNLSLILLIVGYALIRNSLIIFIAGIVAGIISWKYFAPKQERYLSQKYGKAYERYKSMVKF